ncbi:MAG: DUF4173 domain-containing protein [Lachnospiraceae bacterium]|nr:DUF4173 domain-containing protein [Lachnospiraceae bacterium]
MENENYTENFDEEPAVKVAADPIKETIVETSEAINDGFLQKAKDLIDNKNEYIKRIILCAIYAIFYTFCLYKNTNGITFPLFAIATIVVYCLFLKAIGEKIKTFSYVLIGLITLLSINVCMTTSIPLLVFDKIFMCGLFFVLFLYNLYDEKTWDATRYFLAVGSVIVSSIAFVLDPILDIVRIAKDKGEKEEKVRKKNTTILYVLLGLAISVPLLCVILPLLLTSDIVFLETFRKIFSFKIDKDFSWMVVLTILIFFTGYALIKRLCARQGWLETPVADKRNANPVISITISAVLLVFYGLYSGIQIIYLFLGFGTLPKGYTYADYAHEGFFQLVFVCIINLILVLICRKFSKDNKVLKLMLTFICSCTYIMLFSSAYRMILYIGAYGLTFLRVYVLWALAVILLAITGAVILIYQEKMPFVKYSMVVIAATWIAFSMSRPDTYIAEYNLCNHTGERYVVEDLSEDAVPVIMAHRDRLYSMDSMKDDMRLFDYHYADYELSKDVRQFNFAKYNAAKALNNN